MSSLSNTPANSNTLLKPNLFTVVLNEQQIRTLVRLSVDNKRMWQQIVERESMSGGRIEALNNAKKQLVKSKHIISSLRRALACCIAGQSQEQQSLVTVEIPAQALSDSEAHDRIRSSFISYQD